MVNLSKHSTIITNYFGVVLTRKTTIIYDSRGLIRLATDIKTGFCMTES